MHLHFVVLLTVVALVASVDASSVATESTIVNPILRLDRADTNDRQAGVRSLRAEKSTDYDDGERAANWLTKIVEKLKIKIAPKIPPKAASDVVTKVMAQENPSLLAQLNKLVKSTGTTTDDVSEVAILAGQPKLKELFELDRLPFYISYSERTFDRRGYDRWGIETLRKTYTEKELAQIVNIGFKNGDDLSIQTAEQLRAGLLNRWFMEKKQPIDVAQLLKGGQKKMDHFNKEVYNDYLKTYNDLYIKFIV